MKKFLACVVSLIFCLGIFVSCKDEKIYDKIPDLSREGILATDFTNRESEWNYSIFTSYDEFLKSDWAGKDNKENIDKTIFDDFVILEATYSNYDYGDPGDHVGYRNLSIEQTTLILECDYIEDDDKLFYYYYADYYAIPRSEFGKVSPESITEIKVNINTIEKY